MKVTDQDLGLLKQPAYHSFLLRYWQSGFTPGETWLLSLENPITGEIKVFQTVEALTNYLTQLTPKKQVKPEP